MRVGGVEKGTTEVMTQKTKTLGQEVQFMNKAGRNDDGVRYRELSQSGVSAGEVTKAIERANEKVMVKNTELRFSVHEKTNQIMIKVMNSDTQEVIREIPSEKILDMVANFMEIAGLYIDEEA